jgi:hypothetical protein
MSAHVVGSGTLMLNPLPGTSLPHMSSISMVEQLNAACVNDVPAPVGEGS